MSSPIPSRSDVDEIIKKKRKVREHKACYPCRSRKVRCDSQIPCKTCIERNHADICSWNPPPKKVDTGATHGNSSSSNIILSSEEWDRICSKLHTVEKSVAELKQDLLKVTEGFKPSNGFHGSPSSIQEGGDDPSGPGYVKAMDINEQSPLTGETIHLGGGSVPALIKALRKHSETTPAVREVFGSNVLPLFGLDNENATYPFVSLWGGVSSSADRIAELRKALPSDAECLETFRHYRDGGYVTYPGVVEIDKFENDLLVFLSNRRSGQYESDDGEDSMYGTTLHWAALLFAVFASGAQFSPMPKDQRGIVSQLYGCCSFECLRLVNYLAHASLEVVQAMLVLGNVLANGMNAGAAWSFLGMTTRLAQGLGLHRSSEEPSNSGSQAQSRTWWAILWQDSLLSISYDRASSSAAADSKYPPNERKDGLTYHEAMYRVCRVGLETIRNRVAPQSIEGRLSKCGGLRQEVQTAQDSALSHLRSLDSCKSMKDQSEFWMLSLHASYMKSELCRPAISPNTSEFDSSNQLKKLCIENLLKTVKAFLGVANVSPIHTRSWAVTQRALSSSLLLGILGEPLRNQEAQLLLKDLIEVMESTASSGSAALPAPVERSLSALRKLSALESRTPRIMEEPMSDTKSAIDQPYSNFDESNGLNSLNFDTSSYFLPSPLSGFEDESSPYALMDSIIWGGDRPSI